MPIVSLYVYVGKNNGIQTIMYVKTNLMVSLYMHVKTMNKYIEYYHNFGSEEVTWTLNKTY